MTHEPTNSRKGKEKVVKEFIRKIRKLRKEEKFKDDGVRQQILTVMSESTHNESGEKLGRKC